MRRPGTRDDALSRLQARFEAAPIIIGGCGRSGMAVLRLMIEAGEDAETALARLRTIRPCAIETDAQMAWARDL